MYLQPNLCTQIPQSAKFCTLYELILFELTMKFKIAQAIEKASWCIKFECNDRSALFPGKGVSDLETCMDYSALPEQR